MKTTKKEGRATKLAGRATLKRRADASLWEAEKVHEKYEKTSECCSSAVWLQLLVVEELFGGGYHSGVKRKRGSNTYAGISVALRG